MEQIITIILFSQDHLLHRKEEGDWSCGWTLSSQLAPHAFYCYYCYYSWQIVHKGPVWGFHLTALYPCTGMSCRRVILGTVAGWQRQVQFWGLSLWDKSFFSLFPQTRPSCLKSWSLLICAAISAGYPGKISRDWEWQHQNWLEMGQKKLPIGAFAWNKAELCFQSQESETKRALL